MANSKANIFPSVLLTSVSKEASEYLHRFAVSIGNASAAAIAARLMCIAGELSEQGLYKLPPDTQDLSFQALQDLLEICEWPRNSTPEGCLSLKKGPLEVYKLLVQPFNAKVLPDRIQQSIIKFCKEQDATVEPILSRFIKLHDILVKNTQELHGTIADISACSHLEPLPTDMYPDEVHKLLLKGVEIQASCVFPHLNSEPKNSGEDTRHLTRLSLDSGYRIPDELAVFNIVTATSKMTYWQEMAIRVSIPIKKRESGEEQRVHCRKKTGFDSSNLSLMKNGSICEWLERPIYAKVCLDLDEECHLYKRPDPEELQYSMSGYGIQLSELLKRSELTVEHKIKLSYAVARAFWKFYSSDLMKARWTSEDILFVPQSEEDSLSKVIPLRAFVSFPFGPKYAKSPMEYCDEKLCTHRYPRILHLGIILLEIGLGQTLALERDSKSSPFMHINRAKMKAKMKLKELKDARWDGFQWKDYFIEAVENCLEFKDTTKRRKSRHHGHIDDGKKDTKNLIPSERKDAIYRNVVHPLFWLAKIGFADTEEVPLVSLRNNIPCEHASAEDKELQISWSEIRKHPSFYTSGKESQEGFLEDLQVIAGHIARFRRKANVKSIKVAILDTGCNKDLPFFQNPQRAGRLKGWKDFAATQSKSETDTESKTEMTRESKNEIDVFGHGTFMARLLMHVAPIVDVYLIRVAENANSLENNQENIAKAIEHAGLDPEWKVDVISMSFGFPNKPGKTFPVMADAIEKVRKKRDGRVLFLGSAGNSWQRRTDFPASHQDVIPIYAADSKGVFLGSNPTHTGKGPEKLGTYGADIPASIIEEIRVSFPNVDLSAGSSIATAIAAGIVAMTLSYIAALPSRIKIPGLEQMCTELYTKKGMKHMLHAMSLRTRDRQNFINPVWFWGEKTDDMQVFVSICGAVEAMNKEIASES